MKKVTLSIKEFYNFKTLAKKFSIWFLYETYNENIIIEANEIALEDLGY